MNAWAKKIADDNNFHYVKWQQKVTATHECPICKKHSKGSYYGWNCIGFAWAIWHHGGNLANKCNCGVINNDTAEKILNAKTDAEALKIVTNHIGISNVKVIRNKNGIPKSQWKDGDICLKFDGNTYKHTFYYMGNKKIVDSSQRSTAANDIAVRDYDSYTCKIIVRWLG
ncbi:MAG: hypothetical protein IJH55_02990 [Romboutsia sp.]|nr:hypothetical protein [Romboutsia sp.]